jgi:hypothetical protein
MLDERLIQILRQNHLFDEWPLEVLLPDRGAFLTFLQERWPIFLDRMVAPDVTGIVERHKEYGLTIDGPADLPFEHHDIRVYVDSLLLDGLLHPVAHTQAEILSGTWVGLGVQNNSAEAQGRRLDKAMEKLEESLKKMTGKHVEWLNFARGWAELIFLIHAQPETVSTEAYARFTTLQTLVDSQFSAWLAKRYAGLSCLPPVSPVMVHHLPRFLARQTADSARPKIALLVVDGLAIDQWLVIRETFAQSQPAFQFRDEALFAWIPTVTSVSRQAIFAGRQPFTFPDSIWTTEREPTLWKQFWGEQGMAPNEIFYAKGLGDGSLESLAESISHPKIRIAGLVIDKVDNIMHGMQLGTAGMHNQVRQWAQQPYLGALLDMLLDNGFRIYLTSDHGNIEAAGCGQPAEGAVADLRGGRVRVFPSAGLRSKVKERFPTALEWDAIGLPENFLPLLAPARQAFVHLKEHIVDHGGSSLEELIVPLVQIERRIR